MKDLGFGLVDQRTVIVVLITALVAHLLLGFPFPIETQNVLGLFIDLFLLTGYLYIVRTFIRLPFAIGIGFKRALIKEYEMFKKEELAERDGDKSFEGIKNIVGIDRYYKTRRLWHFVVAFFDQDNWKGFLGFIDRAGIVIMTLIITVPTFGVLIMKGVGLFGLLTMLLIYVFGGSFSFLVDDAIKHAADLSIKQHERLVQVAGHPDIHIPQPPSEVTVREKSGWDNFSPP